MTGPEHTSRDALSPLAAHVREGLSRRPKQLSSSWLYDDEGSRLFQRIMALPEYYLTRTEHALLQTRGDALASLVAPAAGPVEVIELGSGDGAKVVTLLQRLVERAVDVTYRPFDISALAMDTLVDRVRAQLPTLRIEPLVGSYFDHWPTPRAEVRQVVLFLGSNLGNFSHAQSVELLQRIRSQMRLGDTLVLGLDMQKDPATILAAYNDMQGVTAAFNLNLLRRINREVGTDFVLDDFYHYALYTPLDGTARSFLVSKKKQRVSSVRFDLSAEFAEGECIYVEQSQKYTVPMIERLGESAGFALSERVHDGRDWFSIAALTAI
ncbi:MAG: L-histidine N(alpha)-methyltransferase [Deltaproteobacteria bacterium]|nr:L-histidine N(alpha)-methyltransferase [Deltaproteobacteria bacterium]